MSTPITWRNIEAPDFRGASVGMATVSNNLEAARKLLTQPIADTERIDAENWDNTKANNTNAVLMRLLEYQDPESFEKARQAGEFRALIDQYGPQIDANLVRKSIDERADVLRNRAIGALDYQNRLRTEKEAEVAREQKPILDRLRGLVEQGELQSATEAARIYAESGMLREDFLRQILEDARKRQEGIDDRTLKKLDTESAINYRDAQAAAARAQAAAAGAQARAARDQARALIDAIRQGNQSDKVIEEQYKAWLAGSILGEGSLEQIGSANGLKELLNEFDLDPGTKQSIRKALEKHFPGGYYPRKVGNQTVRMAVPVALVRRGLMSTENSRWPWADRGEDVAEKVLGFLEDPRTVEEIKNAISIRDWRGTVRSQVGTDPRLPGVMPGIHASTLLRLGELMNPPKNK